MIKGVLFDMDGVLFDSERIGSVIFKNFCEKRGYQGCEPIYLSMLGANHEQDRHICLESFGADFPFDEAIMTLHDWRGSLAIEGKIPLKEGVMEGLRYLKEHGIAAAIVSGTNKDLILTYLDTIPGMRALFQVIIPGDKGLNSKPDPEPYLKAAELLGLKPEECIGVEDSLNGVKSLRASGVLSVCIPDMIPWSADFVPNVDVRLNSMLDLPALIERLNRGGHYRS